MLDVPVLLLILAQNVKEMNEFEKHLKAIFDAYNGVEIDTDAAVSVNAPILLLLAKKEFEKTTTQKPK